MTVNTIGYWMMLVVGLGQVGFACAYWQRGDRQGAVAGMASVALAVSMLSVGWVRYAAWAVLVPCWVILGKRFFTARDPGTLWIGLVFLPIMLGIALTELLVDDLSMLQQAAFSTVAVLVLAAMVTAIVRLVQAHRVARLSTGSR